MYGHIVTGEVYVVIDRYTNPAQAARVGPERVKGAMRS